MSHSSKKDHWVALVHIADASLQNFSSATRTPPNTRARRSGLVSRRPCACRIPTRFSVTPSTSRKNTTASWKTRLGLASRSICHGPRSTLEPPTKSDQQKPPVFEEFGWLTFDDVSKHLANPTRRKERQRNFPKSSNQRSDQKERN